MPHFISQSVSVPLDLEPICSSRIESIDCDVCFRMVDGLELRQFCRGSERDRLDSNLGAGLLSRRRSEACDKFSVHVRDVTKGLYGWRTWLLSSYPFFNFDLHFAPVARIFLVAIL